MQKEGAFDIYIYIFRFVAVQQRSGVRVVISEKFVEIFGWYENDLDMVQQLYEKHKVCFCTCRHIYDNVTSKRISCALNTTGKTCEILLHLLFLHSKLLLLSST